MKLSLGEKSELAQKSPEFGEFNFLGSHILGNKRIHGNKKGPELNPCDF